MFQSHYLLFEDNIIEERTKLSRWLGLHIRTEEELKHIDVHGDIHIESPHGENVAIAATDFDMSYPGMLQNLCGGDAGWSHVHCKTLIYSPRVVILDFLLSGPSGDFPFSGADYGNRLKEEYPDLGVVLITKGHIDIENPDSFGLEHSYFHSQQELTEYAQGQDWLIDETWIKPAVPMNNGAYPGTYVQEKLNHLASLSRRYSHQEIGEN